MEKLLIAVHSDIFADTLAAALDKEYSVRTCTDGCEALALLNSFQPDGLILYLRLPRKDGITVLTQTAYKPSFILAITDYATPFIECQAALAGINCLMLLPTISAITARLTQLRLSHCPKQQEPHLKTAMLLHSLGLNAKVAGWDMLVEGIPLFAQIPDQALGKVLYPEIAKRLGRTDGRAVERAIHRCIESAWVRRDHYVWIKYFPAAPDGTIPCPQNGLFIKTLANAIRQ